MARDKLNIVVPLYNPHADWETNFTNSLEGLEEKLRETDFMVSLVNDGSTIQIDSIEKILNRFSYVRYYSYPVNMGKGYAIRYGITRSEADFYIYTDIDFPFGFMVVFHAYQLLKSGKTNIVIGTRDNSYFRSLPLKRRILSLLLKQLAYLVTGLKIKDTQAGLKGLDNEARKILADTKINSFLFELEFLKKSLKRGLEYKLIKVTSRPGISFTNFRIQIILKEIISLLKIIF
jgi:glycosyltransferase involved in cell wall biosynthesis